MSYQITSAILAIVIAFKIVFLVRKDVLHTRYALWWFVVAGMVVIAGLFPKFIDVVAGMLGISYPPILAMIVGVGMILIKMLTMDIDRSRQEQKIRRLVQRLAIYEEDLGSSQAGPGKDI